jgi:hypothetical protein
MLEVLREPRAGVAEGRVVEGVGVEPSLRVELLRRRLRNAWLFIVGGDRCG